MATTDNATTSSTSTTGSAAFAALSASTIDSIRQQALASAPPEAASFINERFAGTSAAVPATQPATSSAEAPAPAVVGTALAQPTISFIREQILANAPSAYASAIAAQFTTAATGSGQAAAPVQPATPAQPVAPAASNAPGAESSAVGASLAVPAIEFVRQQITAVLPAEYSAAILAQFPSAPAADGPAAPVQLAAGVTPLTSAVADEIRAYFTTQSAPTI